MCHHEDRRTKWQGAKLPRVAELEPEIAFTEKGNNVLMLIGGRSFELTEHEFHKIEDFAKKRKLRLEGIK